MSKKRTDIRDIQRKRVVAFLSWVAYDRKLSKSAIAKLIDAIPQVLTYWENGERWPSAVDIEIICRVFDVPPDTFIKGGGKVSDAEKKLEAIEKILKK